MPTYPWKNKKTGEVAEVSRSIQEHHLAPDDSGDWERIFVFGVGAVEGGGSSPARPSQVRK